MPQRKEPKQNSGRREAVLYARVSSKEQEREGYSILAQLKLLREYAAQQSFEVMREFVDVETAKASGRCEFGKMMSYLSESRDCRIVLAEKTDRLYRNVTDWGQLDELGAELHLPKENFVYSPDSKSAEKFMHGIRVLMAKNFVDNLAEETSKGMRQKASEGLWPSYAPYGYSNAEENGRRVIVPDLKIAPIIAKVFEWFATGEYSLRDVAAMAYDAGLRSRAKGSRVPKSSVHRFLTNPLYYGSFWWDGEFFEGRYRAIVSKELWDRAQVVLDSRSARGRRRRKHRFAFSGLVRCGHCGCLLVGEIKKKKYIYYHCTGAKGNCHGPYVREEALEAALSSFLSPLKLDKETVDWITRALKESQADERRFHDEAITRLQGIYRRLQDRLDGVYVDKLDGTVDEEFFKRMSAQWRAEQNDVTLELGKYERASRSYIETGARILELAERAQELFVTQTPVEKRRLLGFLLSNCTWKNRTLSVEYRQPFDMLAVAATEHQQKKAAGTLPSDLSEIWYPRQDSNLRPSV